MELSEGEDYFSRYKNKIELDCGRSALQYIVRMKTYKRIWLPVYNCPLIMRRLEPMDIEIVSYNIGDDFKPEVDKNNFRDGDLFCWINYWGCMKETLLEEMGSWQFVTPVDMIIDNIPAFFSPPQRGMYNIYSCRKFIGVPDGAYLIYDGMEGVSEGSKAQKKVLSEYEGYRRYMYLLKSIEQGSNEAYKDYLESEEEFTERTEVYEMSKITKRFLTGLDYGRIKSKRRENYRTLDEILKCTNLLDLNGDTQTPAVYPYLSENPLLRDKLIERKIYVSRHWRHILTNHRANSFEKYIANFMIPLPIDQRYSTEDMKYMAHVIHEIERES